MMHGKTRRYSYTQFNVYLFILHSVYCIVVNVARMQTKFCGSCPHHMKG